VTIICSSAPGTASTTFNKNLELILNCKYKVLKSCTGIGHLILNIPTKKNLEKI